MARVKVAFSYPTQKAVLLSAVATVSAITVVMPVQAEETWTRKSFEENKKHKLDKAEAKLEKAQAKVDDAQARVDCIKAAEEMKALRGCK